MRRLLKGDTIYAVQEGQYTQDEKDALIDEAQSALDCLSEGEKGYNEALSLLESAKAIIACTPAGAIELTEDQVEKHKTGLYVWVDGEQVLKASLKTYAQDLAELNNWKRQETERVAASFAAILLLNGTSQAEEGIRQSMLAEIEGKYDADLLALKTKYGVI